MRIVVAVAAAVTGLCVVAAAMAVGELLFAST